MALLPKKKEKKRKEDMEQDETLEILSAFPPLEFCTCSCIRCEHSSCISRVHVLKKVLVYKQETF